MNHDRLEQTPAGAPEATRPGSRPVIGILGGLGPFAHLALERQLLDAARRLAGARRDQEFPNWIVSSVPETPDRTAALAGESSEDPFPWLLWSLRRLERSSAEEGAPPLGADFAIIACNTAHAYLPHLRAASQLPLLDLIEETTSFLAKAHPNARVGLLATTGTLTTELYQRSLARWKLEAFSPLDLDDGERQQRELVMGAIFGPAGGDGGIKGGGDLGEARRRLARAAKLLVQDLEVDVLVAGCTEISMVRDALEPSGRPLVDPLKVIAEVAIRRAYGI